MENGGNDKYWRGQTGNNNNNINESPGVEEEEEEEEMGTSRPYDYWTSSSSSNVVLMNSHDHREEVEEEEVMINPLPITISNSGGVAKKVKQYLSSCSLYSARSSHVYPDPHLTCLKLGNPNHHHNNKRRQYYFEGSTSNIISTTTTTTTTAAAFGKKGKCYSDGDGVHPLLSVGFGGGSSSTSTVVIPRCQVDGCHVELLCAGEYHRRHKVCEVHSKTTKVEVLGIQQRFCQQCSRFHVITEFDDSKRSCRRRLAGHNERRRKVGGSNSSSSSSNDSTTTSTTRKCFDQVGEGGGVLPHTKIPSRPRVPNALSLLSTPGVSPATTDLIPGKYSTVVALQDLIAENRVNIVASQLFLHPPSNNNIKHQKY